MSADDPAGGDENSDEDSLPRVPSIEDPRHETPLTEDFETGTANDPPLPSEFDDGDRIETAEGSLVTLTVDGESVAVREGATVLDALRAAGVDGDVPALCSYDRDTEAVELVGPRSTCRTCVVETDAEGLVPSCSHPVSEGQTVRTDAAAATEAREVNLDLVLSNHNLRCTACGANGDCELQEAAIDADVHHPRYGVFDDRDAYEPIDDTSSVIQIDRNRCILCNRCVEEIREAAGPDALACFASSKCTNEEDYLMQKFARQVLGTKNIDNCARLCHSSTVAALLQTVGYGAMSNSIQDVANTDAYLITGSNTTESHPVLATRIKQNVREGADLVVFDPREVGISEHADQYSRVEPGYDVAWINGLTRYTIEHDLHDDAFVENQTKHFEELREKVDPFTPEEVERLAEVPPEELASAAETIATADSCVFGWAMGMTQHSYYRL
jgi:predicted molibdopterin-dependent oxidoreductase YjgC